MTNQQPDFWGFLQQQAERWHQDMAKARGDEEIERVRDSWLNPKKGILVRLMDDPYFALAIASAQKVFIDYMLERIELDTKYRLETAAALRSVMTHE